MDALFSEREADNEVIESLVRANRQKSCIIGSLEEQLKRRQGMSLIIKSMDGKFYRVEAEQEVSAEDVQAALDRCQAEADALRALVAPPAPAEDAPAAQAAPAAPEAPVAPEQPAEPVADPNAAPAQPEQSQQAAQPDVNALPPLQ